MIFIHKYLYMGVSKNRGFYPKSSILIGFGTIIFTIHFGGFPPIFGNTHIYQPTQKTTGKVSLQVESPAPWTFWGVRPLRGPPTYSSCEVVAPWAPWNQDHFC